MAKGTDSEEFAVLSRIPAGLKREFAFAMMVQSEICGSSLGRTRASNNRDGVHDSPTMPNNNKRSKKCPLSEVNNNEEQGQDLQDMEKEINLIDTKGKEGRKVEDMGDAMSEDEAKSDVVDLAIDDEPKHQVGKSMGDKEAEDGASIPIHGEEPKSNAGGTVSNEEPKTNHSLESSHEERMNEIAQPIYEDHRSKREVETSLAHESLRIGETFSPKQEGTSGITPVSVNDVYKVKEMLVEKPLRRFTRSSLKRKFDDTKLGIDEESTCDKPVGTCDNVKTKSEAASLMATPTQIKRPGTSSKKFPAKLKDLLATGILEGLPVKYVRGMKVRRPGEAGIHGVIRGSGIVCYCVICKGVEVVTPTVFELHAGSSNKRPPEYIYLENGRTLRDIMNICVNVQFDKLEEAIQIALGDFSLKKSSLCLNCRASIAEADEGLSKVVCDSCMLFKESQPGPSLTEETTSSCVTQAVTSSTPECVLVPKSLNNGMKHSSSQGKSNGRLTRKDLRLHKLVFEEDMLPDGTEVAYYSRGQRLLVGYKKGFGIVCGCCNSEVSPSQFEAHAGWPSRRKPYLHIYTSNGVSLHELSISLSKGRKFSTGDSDDLCSICSDGGDLLCCDRCPRAFHIDCVPLPCIPTGTWYCKHCENLFLKDKYVEHNANAIAAGRIAGIDPLEQINQRCIRIVRSVEVDHGGCTLCRSHDFSKSFGSRTVIICDQCEKEYHLGCLKDHNMQNLEELPEGNWFCCTDCGQIHAALLNLVACGEEKLLDSLLSMIQKKYQEKGLETGGDLDIKWRVLNWKLTSSDETRQLLSKAVAIFHDCFDPIVDSTSGRDFIPTMLYGRNIRGQDFGGMYCAVLIVNQIVVSAGVFRIFGPEVAELPLVATSKDCQGQGYFQALFSCIETLLGSLNVRHLVLPAADEAESIWTSKFGFTKLEQDELNNYKRYYRMMIFQGTSMLRKPVPSAL